VGKMTMKIVLSVLFSLAAVSATAQELMCPMSMITNQSAASFPDGFENSVTARKMLKNGLDEVQIYPGSFEDGATGVSDEIEEGADGIDVFRYRLDKDASHTLQCGYFGTDVVVLRALKPGLTRCEVRHDRRYVLSIGCD
jgi:hypothetical protein